VELSMRELLSRLVPGVFLQTPRGTVYSLVNEDGEPIFSEPEALANAEGAILCSVPIGPLLPGWQIVVRVTDADLLAGNRRTIIMVSAIVLPFLLIALTLGGAAILRQAHESRKEALLKTSFVSNVSHELKTPLTSIRMYADLLQRGRIEDESRRDRYLNVIATESQRLTRLLDNVLSFGRLEQKRERYRIEDLDLVASMEEILDPQRLRLEEAGMLLEFREPEGVIHVRADRMALEQTMLNLIDNAAKYAAPDSSRPPGSPRPADDKTIVVALAQQGSTATLRVMDRGPGVPAEFRERIFEKFFRIDDRMTARKQGTGLGLSIARRLMRDMGGDLVYEERDGGGSCFVMTLPLAPAAQTEEA
jgi:signal transduction histidine kinase